jgi:hypothetical protein
MEAARPADRAASTRCSALRPRAGAETAAKPSLQRGKPKGIVRPNMNRPLSGPAATPHNDWRQKLERLTEPGSMNHWVTVLAGLAVAALYGWLLGNGKIEALILISVWLGVSFVIIFVRDFWWAPLLLVTALTFQTRALGFSMTGLEVGIVILGLTVPIKLALRTLTRAKPEMNPGVAFWLLFAYVAAHAIVIYFYSQIDGAPQIKNIVKAYYRVLSPLIVYALLIRYCHTRTVKPVMLILSGIYFFVVAVAIPVIFLGIDLPELSKLRIQVDWANAASAIGSQRANGPLLLTCAVALYPAVRSNFHRLFLVLSMAVAFTGTLFGAGRTSAGMCIAALIFFCLLRRRFLLLLGAFLAVGVASLTISGNPDVLHYLPPSIHRSLVILNFSEQRTSIQTAAEGSDRWHEELRIESIPYWFQDPISFLFGHGYKSWDDSFTTRADYGADYELAKKTAIQMGLTENAFNSITNIFGLAGLVLYVLFLVGLARTLWRGRQVSPPRSYARGICEFSLVSLFITVLFSMHGGGMLGVNVLFFQLGILAARPYLAAPQDGGVSQKTVNGRLPLNRPALPPRMGEIR